MSDDSVPQPVLFADADHQTNLLAALIERSRLYRTGADYIHLMTFISRMRHMAPFNATLLHMQKPGLQFAATEADWLGRFGRSVTEGARPLLVLWPFAPVVPVYDVEDTEGPALPADVAAPFRAYGEVTDEQLREIIHHLTGKSIRCKEIGYGQGRAGHVRATIEALGVDRKGNEWRHYEIRLNARHEANVRFATLAHELGHICLGHLGEDKRLNIKDRSRLSLDQEELEAEMVAYLVCERQGVTSVSESYLMTFVENEAALRALNLYGITQAAGRVEQALGIAAVLDIGIVHGKKREGASEPSPSLL